MNWQRERKREGHHKNLEETGTTETSETERKRKFDGEFGKYYEIEIDIL